MKKERLLVAACIAIFCFAAAPGFALDDNAEATARSFEFKYGATITGVPKGSTVRVWFPIAESNGQQTISKVSTNMPAAVQENRDATYGNRMGYFELKPQKDDQKVQFDLTYDVTRNEARIDHTVPKLTSEEKEIFLNANALVPIDGKPLALIEEVNLPAEVMDAGQMLYNVVEQHMKYDKSKPGYGEGNVLWACDSKTGNCTDFHSLFISLARSRSIPARFEIGFPLPGDKQSGTIGGYHCWAWFHVDGKGWVPVDISEADKHPEMKSYYFGKLTPDRISFSTGRDIVLVPKSKVEAKNYFVYPHVEVDGKPWPKEKTELEFSFRHK